MAALTSSLVAPVVALSSRTIVSAKFQARKAPVAKRMTVVTQAMAGKKEVGFLTEGNSANLTYG
eukprot:4030132-Pyramimonas_sp.AAC.2